jgi:hypothetical protein
MEAEAIVEVPASFIKNCTDALGSFGKFAQDERAKKASFDAKIDDTVSDLVNQGVIHANVSTKVAERIKNDPAHVFDLLKKVASFTRPQTLGKSIEPESKEQKKSASVDGRSRSKADEAFESRMLSV